MSYVYWSAFVTVILLIYHNLITDIKRSYELTKQLPQLANALLDRVTKEDISNVVMPVFQTSTFSSKKPYAYIFDAKGERTFLDTYKDESFVSNGYDTEEFASILFRRMQNEKLAHLHHTREDGIMTIAAYRVCNDKYCVIIYTTV